MTELEKELLEACQIAENTFSSMKRSREKLPSSVGIYKGTDMVLDMLQRAIAKAGAVK